MLGNYEKRYFADGEKVWLGRYKNLTNVLHWHCECELIRIAQGHAQVRIGAHSFDAVRGDVFFCAGEDLHYIIGTPDSRIDVLILHRSITKDITDRYALVCPKLSADIAVQHYLKKIQQILACKGPFYRDALEAWARSLTVEIFRNCEITVRKSKPHLYNDLISKINDEFTFITFSDAVEYCGYSPSHFSKVFKTISGMSFSDYLNIIRIENAIQRMQEDPGATIASISAACGFSTIRNFNRVFRELTGFSPRSLPENYALDTHLHISVTQGFDPTQKTSVLEQSTQQKRHP